MATGAAAPEPGTLTLGSRGLRPAEPALLPGHRDPEELLRADQVVGVLGGGVDVELHPLHVAVNSLSVGP